MQVFKFIIRQTAVAFAFLCFYGVAAAQDEEGKPALVTDRPDMTESATIVPVGSIQLETGLLYTSDKTSTILGDITSTSFSIPNNLFRIGIIKPLELRVIFGEYGMSKGKLGAVSVDGPKGLSPLAVGTKVKFWDEKGWIPETAIIAHVTLPLGGKDVKPLQPIYDYRFSLAHTFSDKLSLGYNIGGEYDPAAVYDPVTDTYSGEYAGIYTIALGVGITDKFGVFGEFFGDYMDAKNHEFDAGLTYMLAELIQFDLSGGFGLTEEANDFFISSGITFRWLK